MIAVSGRKLLSLRRDKLAMTRAALAHATNRSAESIRLYERDQVNAVPGEFIRAVAELVGEDFGMLRVRLGPKVGDVIDTATMRKLGEEPEDENVEKGSKHAVPSIPLYDLPLAAGGWNDVPEGARLSDEGFKSRGRFRVRLTGDSMEPVYPDGQIVEFEYVYGTDFGKDYYVQLLDGRATFKRLVTVEGDGTVVLAALNSERYPRRLRVQNNLIAHYARAVGTFNPT